MEAVKEESPEAGPLGSENGTAKTTERSLPRGAASVNGERRGTDGGGIVSTASDTHAPRFRALLETHVPRLKVTGTKATGHVPWREDKHPSFSADLAKGVWFDHGRGEGGGVKRFAELVGDPWGTTRLSTCDRARFAGQVRRREAEAKARAILTRRKDEREDALWAAWGKANTTATDTAELLALFFRHPDLVEAFPALVATTEREYADALWRQMLIEQRVAGEVVE